MSGMAQGAIQRVTSHPRELLVSINKADYTYSHSHSQWKVEAESAHQTSSWSWFKLPVPAPSDLCMSYNFPAKRKLLPNNPGCKSKLQ